MGATTNVEVLMQLDSVALAEAGAVAIRRLAEHFASGQGFSITDVGARADWFSGSFGALLRSDMGNPNGDLGYVDFDPFTGAQDDATSFRLVRVRAKADTAYADFAIVFGLSDATVYATHEVSLAMVRVAPEWRIADIMNADHSIATGIRGFLSSSRQ